MSSSRRRVCPAPGCGKALTGRKKACSARCRKALQRAREEKVAVASESAGEDWLSGELDGGASAPEDCAAAPAASAPVVDDEGSGGEEGVVDGVVKVMVPGVPSRWVSRSELMSLLDSKAPVLDLRRAALHREGVDLSRSAQRRRGSTSKGKG